MIITRRNKHTGEILGVKICGASNPADSVVKSDNVYTAVITSNYAKSRNKFHKNKAAMRQMNTFESDILRISSYNTLHRLYHWHTLTAEKYNLNGKSLPIVDCHPMPKLNNDIVAKIVYDHKQSQVIFYQLGKHDRLLATEMVD